ncbi:hypothetical protein SUGI_0774050 [Cryptomeria japonica]|uniref:serine/threonine protein phosphatase 2A 57 kDa regulatory subunit B' beta isoform isoform X2 n=1 Tax=Cryptomeria japonica TaxID=3369 RepID=UPI002414A9FA|nr:serine/threonine protein phosphatase 2A 57 kDa regulatory subunit B' beta isoform isoform X2 [Cryptomeria japonica]GLJ38020.1 hypothetical protein SUGI_0774050 [Cryptomeria japonica]
MFAKLMGRRLSRKPAKSETNGTGVPVHSVRVLDEPSKVSVEKVTSPARNGLSSVNAELLSNVETLKSVEPVNNDIGSKVAVALPVPTPGLHASPMEVNDMMDMIGDDLSPDDSTVVSTVTVENLPLLRDVPVAERHDLLIKKLSLCCQLYDFLDPKGNVTEKEIKRQTLLEIVDYIQYGAGKFTESIHRDIANMLAVNLFRTMPPAYHESTGSEKFDREEEDACMEPAWPHLQLVYEVFLQYIISTETDPRIAKRYIDRIFVMRLLDLFDSEDPREREYSKTILHRIYGKYMMHRPFIRKAINNIFYRFIYETERHNGIGELLEILGSIINGFAMPLKEEHKLFLARVLIPLHRPKCISFYHQQLSYCITQFVEKDYRLIDPVIRGLLKFWPVTNSQKEVMLLGELEELLEITQSPELECCMVPLFQQIGRCLQCLHFQVAERALFFWSNDHIVNLIAQNRNVILPLIFEALEKNTACHWHHSVNGLTMNVRKMFMEMDENLYKECQVKFQDKQNRTRENVEKRAIAWKQLEAASTSKGIFIG